MTKNEFLEKLRKKLNGVPKDEIEERLSFYSEMIDDRVEEGLSEGDAVAEIGNIDNVASQILSDIPLRKIVKEKIKPKREVKAWEIVLIVLGAPLWIPLIIALLSVFFAQYVVLWSVLISIWAVAAGLVACVIGAFTGGIIFICMGNILTGLVLIGSSLICTGIALLFILLCKGATKAIIFLTKKIAVGVKNLFVKKEK